MRKIFKLSSILALIFNFGCSKSAKQDSHDSPAPATLSPKQSDKDESKAENKEPKSPDEEADKALIEIDKPPTETDKPPTETEKAPSDVNLVPANNETANDKTENDKAENDKAETKQLYPLHPFSIPQVIEVATPQPISKVQPEIPDLRPKAKRNSKDQILVLDPKRSGNSEFSTYDDFVWDFRGVFDVEALDYLKKLSIQTGGFVTFSPRPNSFADSVDAVLDMILKDPGTSGNDVVLIIDTTNSMANDIRDLKAKKDEILKKLKEKSDHVDLKLSLIAYRDKNNSYLAKIFRDFTSSTRSFGGAIDELNAGEGNKDIPEATLDALELAATQLSWRADSKHSVILASDAPGFPVSYSNQTFEQIVDICGQEKHRIAIYSILAGSLE
ncbi:MAG: VWA domain-containing protein [Bdellovibrionales bacterium]|nr:VWA domain-containing protein [Bdellovibrionales bacterium]